MEYLAKIKQRAIFFVENQGIKKEDFYKKIGSNGGNFRGKSLQSELSGDKIAEILANYPIINPEWLLTGKGPMLKNTSYPSINSNISVNEPNTSLHNTKVDHKEKYYELLEENRELRLKMERIEDKHNIELEKLKETHQKQVQEIEKYKKELEKFRKSKNNNAMLQV